MKRIPTSISRPLLAAVLLLLPALLHAQSTVTEYKGVIGGKMKITMQLQKQQERMDDGGEIVHITRYSGSYSYDSQGKPIRLSGLTTRYEDQPDDPFGMIQIEEEADGKQTGSFSGQLTSAGSFIGNWSNADYTRSYPFVLYPADAGGTEAALRDIDDLSVFWDTFRELVKSDQKEKIADMTVFPLAGSGYVIERWEQGMNRKEFLKNYKKIFDRETKRTVEKSTIGDLYPSVASEENLWEIPGGTPVYFMVINYIYEGDEGGASVGYGFAKVGGVYKLVVMEMAG